MNIIFQTAKNYSYKTIFNSFESSNLFRNQTPIFYQYGYFIQFYLQNLEADKNKKYYANSKNFSANKDYSQLDFDLEN